MRHISNQTLRGWQLMVALLVGAFVFLWILDAAQVSSYTMLESNGPTMAAYSTTTPMLSLPLWIAYLVTTIVAVGVSLYGSNGLAKILCYVAIACCIGVMLLSWTNTHPRPIYGVIMPTNFYLLCLEINVVLVAINSACERRNDDRFWNK